MTEDTSTENLRKFLESDDPATIMMGLSMIKGVGLTEDLIAVIAGLYMWHDSPVIRRKAKKYLFDQAPDNVKSTVELYWDAKYQKLRRASKLEVITKELISAFDQTPLNDIKLWKWAIFREVGWEYVDYRYPSDIILTILCNHFGLKTLDLLFESLEKNEGLNGVPMNIGSLGPDTIGPIVNKLKNNKERAIRIGLIDALMYIAQKNENSPQIHNRILDEGLSTILIELLRDKDYYLREKAMIAIGILEDKSAAQPLKNYIESEIANEPIPMTEYYLTSLNTAIHALGLIKEDENCDFLTTILKEYNVKCNRASGEEIGEDYDDDLEISDKGYAKNVCINIIISLSHIGNRKTIQIIESVTKDLIEVERKGLIDGGNFSNYGSAYSITEIGNISKDSIDKIKTNSISKENDSLFKKLFENPEATSENLCNFLESNDPAMIEKGISIIREESPDTYPENLQEFLKSDNPVMVKIGLFMAKEEGLTDKLLSTVLRLYMWDGERGIRAEAKSVFNKYAPKNILAKIKENWKPGYRTLSVNLRGSGYSFVGGDDKPDRLNKVISTLLKEFKSNDDIAQAVLYKLIRSTLEPEGITVDKYGDSSKGILQSCAVSRLKYLDDIRAIRPLVRLLKIDEKHIEKALANIGDRSITDPLINMINEMEFNSFRGESAESSAQYALTTFLHNRGAVPPHLPADADWKYSKKIFRKKFDWEYQDYLQ